MTAPSAIRVRARVPSRLIGFEEARSCVLERATPLPAETVALRSALGRVVAEVIRASSDVPAFANSAMDGFAVRASDAGPGVRLRVVDESRAGAPASATIGVGEACAISTGAAIPAGTDTVIRVEDTRTVDGEVELLVSVEPDRDVRHPGEDVRAGQVVLDAGVRLGPAELGVLASLGRARVLAGPRPRVAIVTTGDELVGVDEELRPGMLHNSGAHVMPALVEQAGGRTISVAHARDDPGLIREAIGAALEADATVITGGMSVGEHDHVGEALASLGVTRRFAGVALRPGKPMSFGTRGSTLVFGLPGNPVSSLVTFVLFARPALRALAGEHPPRERTVATLAVDCDRIPERVQAVRCRIELHPDGWHAITTGPQSSHILTSLLGADALAIIPAGVGVLAAGEQVFVERL
jgi:molybdopterin molybdotransferase